MTGRSRFRFRFRGVMSLVQSIASQFFDILQKEEAASNTNVFYDPADLTSLRVNTDGSGGNPVVGDPVGMMLDTSQFGGKTAEAYLAGATELVTNGTFDTDVSGWSAYRGSISWSSGQLAVASNGSDYGAAVTTLSLTLGATYYIAVQVGDAPVATPDLWIGTTWSNGSALDASGMSANSLYSSTFVASASTMYITLRASNAGTNTVKYDNISVKEIPGHHAIAPSDSARPVLFDDPDLTAAALTDNGQRGAETVTTSYPATFTSQACGLLNNAALEIGALYEITWDVASADGAITLFLVDSAFGGAFTYQVLTYTAGTGSVVARCNAKRINSAYVNGTATINSISVRKVNTVFDERGPELVTNGTFDSDISGWADFKSTSSWDAGRLSVVYDSVPSGVYQTFSTVSGKWYEAKVDVVSSTEFNADTKLRVGNGVTPNNNPGLVSVAISSAGTAKLIFQATGSTSFIYLRNRNAATTVWDNVSVKQVLYPNLVTNGTFDTDSDWSKGTGWSIGSGVASCDGTQTSPSAIATPITMSANKFYKAQVYISSVSAGSIDFRIGAAAPGTAFSTVGWHTFIVRYTSGGNFNVFASTDFVGSIDNVSLQELPASIDRKYYLDTDGSDDWMEVKPTLNLGEQWWHVGAWQSDANGATAFSTSSVIQGGLRELGGEWAWYTGASTFSTIASGAQESKHVITIEQSDTNGIHGLFNGAGRISLTPYDDSGATQGLALFSQENDTYTNGLDGRFYGGSWGQGQVDYDELTVLQDYLGTTTQPPIDPPDVTEYADVYELLAAQTGAVLFDIDDTTSLRVGRKGSGGVPVDGDPVGMMLDVSDTGGLTMEGYLSGATELYTEGDQTLEGTGGAPVNYNAAPITVISGEYYLISGVISGDSTAHRAKFSSVTSGAIDLFEIRTTGAYQRIVQATSDTLYVHFADQDSVDGNQSIHTNISIKEISSHAAIAPSDSARPNLATENSPISSREVLTTTFGWNITDGGRA